MVGCVGLKTTRMYAKKILFLWNESFYWNKKEEKMAFDIIKSRKNLRRESIDLFVLIFLYYFGAFVVNWFHIALFHCVLYNQWQNKNIFFSSRTNQNNRRTSVHSFAKKKSHTILPKIMWKKYIQFKLHFVARLFINKLCRKNVALPIANVNWKTKRTTNKLDWYLYLVGAVKKLQE